MPHTPTSGQISKLVTLKATVTSTAATLASAQTSLAAAQTAYNNAVNALKQYEAYMYGSTPQVGTIDGGNPDAA